MDIVDILLHVPADLSAKDCSNIEYDLQGCDGVLSAHFSKTGPHMLEIAYDPRTIDSEALRQHVSERGLAVSKIGL